MSFMMQAGTFQLSSSGSPAISPNQLGKFTRVDFPVAFPAGSEVIVIPMVQTFNGGDSPGLRITDVTRTGFRVRLNELVGQGQALSDGPHTNEKIGYLAIAM